MRKSAREEAEQLVEDFGRYCYCFLGSGMLTNTYSPEVNKMNAKQCAIITQQRIIDLPIWFVHNEEELDHQIEILKEIKKL